MMHLRGPRGLRRLPFGPIRFAHLLPLLKCPPDISEVSAAYIYRFHSSLCLRQRPLAPNGKSGRLLATSQFLNHSRYILYTQTERVCYIFPNKDIFMALPPQKFREAVLQILYSQDFVLGSEEIIPMMMEELKTTRRTMMDAADKVAHILVKLPELDEYITSASTEYSFERISRVEKTILRLGLYESNLLHMRGDQFRQNRSGFTAARPRAAGDREAREGRV